MKGRQEVISNRVLSRVVGRRRAFAAAVATVAAALSIAAALAGAARSDPSWSMSGQGITNWRYQPNERTIDAHNAKSLSVRWASQLAGDISATPAVVDGVAYVPDWGGKLSAVSTKTGQIIWQKSVKDLANALYALVEDSNPSSPTYQTVIPDTINPVLSRTSPAVSGNTVVIGTQTMRSASARIGDGAELLAIDKANGNLLWKTKLDDHPLSIDTQSPTIHNGVVYVGVASIEENGVDCGDPGDTACYFRGSLQAVNLRNGSLLWKTHMISRRQQAAGYSGAAIWGSSPAIDVKRNSVYIATGNNYSASLATSSCVTAANGNPQAIIDCETTNGVGNYVDAVASLNLDTGAVKWVSKLQGFDAWTTACIGLPTACPAPNGPDFDFGQGPMLIPTKAGDIVAAGQKSGIMWGLNAATGAPVWQTLVGPGSSLGGLEWGSATDGSRIYFAVVNFNVPAQSYPMVHPPKGTPATSSAGSWGAVNAANGKIIWQTADPNGSIERRERSRLRELDGRALLPRQSADDVRPRRWQWQATLAVHERRIRQRGAGDRRRHGLLGLGLHPPRLRWRQQQALRVLDTPQEVRAWSRTIRTDRAMQEAGETIPGFLRAPQHKATSRREAYQPRGCDATRRGTPGRPRSFLV
jgi:polyvinyl alcohol dehydrogenase (cytochrome)